MSDEVPHSPEWFRSIGYTVLSIFILANLLFRPRRFTDGLITYISMLSYVFLAYFCQTCSLWPIPVALMVWALVKYPSKSIMLYALYVLFTHRRDSHHNGSEVSTWLGAGYVGSAIRRYLHASLHTPHLARLQELARSGTKFVFAVHPHSLFGVSALVNFGLGRLFTKDVLGVDFRVLTINMNFMIPVLREYLLARGFVCADKRTFAALLARNIAPVIVPGGAEETLFASAGCADLVINKRFGFVREAIANGAWLVPVYCFGDNEAVPTVRLSAGLMYFQRILQKSLSFALPIGIPFFKQSPIRMVVGEPLPPPTSGSFTERVLLYHTQYKEALKTLFKDNLAQLGSEAEKKGKGIRFLK